MEQARLRLIAWLHARPAAVFGLDLRSLALFRVLLGLSLLADAWLRLGDARSFYTDAGVMPRQWLARFGEPERISLYLANGQTWFAASLLLLQAAAALALALGWRTRWATIVSFVLEASLLNRAPLSADNGDALLCCLLFWSMFLPLGTRASLDCALAPAAEAPQRHLSWAGAGLVLQLAAVFLFAGLALQSPQWSPDFSALHEALLRDADAAALGRWLRPREASLHAVSAALYYLQRWAVLLLLLPLWRRPLHLLGICLLAALELVLALLFVQRGLAVAVLLALPVLVDGWVWDAWTRRLRVLRIYYDGDCAACLELCRLARTLLVLPRAELAPAQEHARARALFEANRSWVVIDQDDRAYLKWPAAALLLRRSPVWAPLGWLLSGAWSTPPGNALYDHLGRRRAALAALFKHLPREAPPPTRAGICRWLAVAALLLVLGGNLAAIGWLPGGLAKAITPPLKLLRLDQPWDWYTPLVSGADGWFVAAGLLADGSTVDLLRPDRPLSFDRPADVAGSYPNPRWRAYQSQLLGPQAEAALPAYADYLCRRWNATAPAARALLELKIINLLAPMRAAGAAAAVEQRILWRRQCSGSAPGPALAGSTRSPIESRGA